MRDLNFSLGVKFIGMAFVCGCGEVVVNFGNHLAKIFQFVRCWKLVNWKAFISVALLVNGVYH